jgi:S1-C subfamily serine protease
MKHVLPFVLAASALASLTLDRRATALEVSDEVLAAEAQRVAVIQRACQATIAIFARGGRGGGSGVVISPDGFALSNFHVTSGAGTAMKVGMADGHLYDAVIVGIDPVGDVALIKLLGRDDFPYAPMGDSDQVRQGDWCFAAGNPFLLATDFQPTVTFGLVSGVNRYQYPAGTLLEYADCIQIDASINPGNSGGPLFNLQGEVIGINGRGSFEKRGRVNVGVGYAISINQIKKFLGCLKAGRIVDHATMGATVYTSEDGRVLVGNILDSSDAWRRGLRYGDEITYFGGRPITTANDFKNVLGTYPKGWLAPLTYRRDGQSYDVWVRLAGVHQQQELIDKVSGRGQRPQPQPGPQPGPGRPGERPQPQPAPRPGQPPRPQPDGPDVPKPDEPAPPVRPGGTEELPDIVKQHYEERKGYANYYFNRVEQQRVWDRLRALGDFTSLRGKWLLQAEIAAGLPSSIELRDDGAILTLPGGKAEMVVGPTPEFAQHLDPPGSGGLVPALYLWRRFLTHGIDRFGTVYYFGTVPRPGHRELLDCLVCEHGGVQCRLLFDPSAGHLVALEFYPADDVDPCELNFSQFVEHQGRSLPQQIEVRHGDQVYQVFKLTATVLDKAAED